MNGGLPDSICFTGGIVIGIRVVIECGVRGIQLTSRHDQLIAGDRDRDADTDSDNDCLTGQTTGVATRT